LHLEAFIYFSIVKKNCRVLRSLFHFLGPLTWSMPLKKLPIFGMYYKIIPQNFVKIYGFKNITGTSGFFCRTRVIFHFFRKNSYRSSRKWYELHRNFPKFCENSYYGLFWYHKHEVSIYCVECVFSVESLAINMNSKYVIKQPLKS
jgi:hypothetical protein